MQSSGKAMFNADGEIGKALVGYGYGLSQVADGLESITKVMKRAEKAEILETLKEFAMKIDAYGHDGLLGLVEKIQAEVVER